MSQLITREQSQQANVSVSLVGNTAFDVGAAVLQVEKMRGMADSNWQRYELPGRNAVIALMAEVYALWHAANAASSSDRTAFMANIKQKLTNEGFEIKQSSKDSALLIRFVFTNADDKQRHVYGRSLDLALTKKTAPDGFEALVRSSGGFEGMRAEAAATEDSVDKSVTALSRCSTQPSLESVKLEQWAPGEKYKVLIAVRTGLDGWADLKDSLLDTEQAKKVLMQFEAARKAKAEAGKPKELTKPERELVETLAAQIKEHDAKAKQITLELLVAESDNDNARMRELTVESQVNNALRDALQASIDRVMAKTKTA